MLVVLSKNPHTDPVTASDPQPRSDLETRAIPQDYTARLVAGWHAERPDLQVDPVAIVNRLRSFSARSPASASGNWRRNSGSTNLKLQR